MKPVQVSNKYQYSLQSSVTGRTSHETGAGKQQVRPPTSHETGSGKQYVQQQQVQQEFVHSLQSSVTGGTSHETSSGKQQVPVQPPVLSHWQNQP